MERNGVTYKSVDVEFEGRVVALFRIVKMYEEEYICPYVMFVVDVVVETLVSWISMIEIHSSLHAS